jgi:S1-C subfamily serine protease
VDTVNRVVSELIAYGKVVRPRLGVETDDRLSAYVTRRLGVRGLLLWRVDKGSPAARSGLRGTTRGRGGIVPGDVLQEIDGKAVTTSDEFLGRLGHYRPGDTITLTLWRDGEVLKVKAVLEAAD